MRAIGTLDCPFSRFSIFIKSTRTWPASQFKAPCWLFCDMQILHLVMVQRPGTTQRQSAHAESHTALQRSRTKWLWLEPASNFPVAYVSGIFPKPPTEILISWQIWRSLCATQIHMLKEWCWLSQINACHWYFTSRIDVLFLAYHFYLVHIHRKEKVLLLGWRITIHNSEPFPNLFFFLKKKKKTFSNYLSHNSPAKGWPYIFHSRRTNNRIFHTGPWSGPFVLW